MKGYLVILNYQTTAVTLCGLCLNSYSKISTFSGSLSFTVIHLKSFKIILQWKWAVAATILCVAPCGLKLNYPQ
jgi:hypothetical protein